MDEKQTAAEKKTEHRLNESEVNRTGTVFDKYAHEVDLSKSQNKQTYEYARKSYRDSVDKWKKSGEEYAKAQEAYLKTPIAKLDAAKDKINTAKNYVSNVLKGLFEDKPAKITDVTPGIKSKDEPKPKDEPKVESKIQTKTKVAALIENDFANHPNSFDEMNRYVGRRLSNDQIQELINPNFNESEKYQINCAFCSAAYDLQKRGYDVQAMPVTEKNNNPPNNALEIERWYEGANHISHRELYLKVTDDNSLFGRMKDFVDGGLSDLETQLNAPVPNEAPEMYSRYLEEELIKFGEGARGFLNVSWISGGAHSIIWEVENGKVVIRDNQTGKTHRVIDVLSRTDDFKYFRCDNLEPTDHILRAVTNRK